MIKYELDFTGAKGVQIVSGRSRLEGVSCTSIENGDSSCHSVATDGITTTGTQERADEVYHQFRQSICPP